MFLTRMAIQINIPEGATMWDILGKYRFGHLFPNLIDLDRLIMSDSWTIVTERMNYHLPDLHPIGFCVYGKTRVIEIVFRATLSYHSKLA